MLYMPVGALCQHKYGRPCNCISAAGVRLWYQGPTPLGLLLLQGFVLSQKNVKEKGYVTLSST